MWMESLRISREGRCRFSKALWDKTSMRWMLPRLSCAAHCPFGAFPVLVPAGQLAGMECHNFCTAPQENHSSDECLYSDLSIQ